MKFAFLLLTLGSFALAHGPLAEQGANAVDAAVTRFLKQQPKDTTRQFHSISATVAGHEKFSVVITLKDQTTKFNFNCAENENVEPVAWECQ